MSPEIISSSYYDTKADIYALGIVLWEILTQERPYSGIKETTVLRNVVDAAQGGCSLRPQIPKWINTGCMKLLKSCWNSNHLERPTCTQIRMKLLVIKDEGGPIVLSELGYRSRCEDSFSREKKEGVVKKILQAEMKEMDHHAKMLSARKKLLQEQLSVCNSVNSSKEHQNLLRRHLEQNSRTSIRVFGERTGRRQRIESAGSAYSTFPLQQPDSHEQSLDGEYAPLFRRSLGP